MKFISPQDFDKQLLDDASKILLSNTVQILEDDIYKGYRSLGSGILFSFEGNYFIISASHNFVYQKRLLGKGIDAYSIQVGDALHTLKYERIIAVPPTNYNINKIDIAIVVLESTELIDALTHNKNFITLDDINFCPRQRVSYEINTEPSDYYVLFGFPATKSKRLVNAEASSVQTYKYKVKAYCQLEYLKARVPKDLLHMGFTDHIFFSKIKKGANISSTLRLNKPIQNGMSGCGLWEINTDYVDRQPKLKLAGIFTEFQKGFGVSVKLKYAIHIIREELNLYKLPVFKV